MKKIAGLDSPNILLSESSLLLGSLLTFFTSEWWIALSLSSIYTCLSISCTDHKEDHLLATVLKAICNMISGINELVFQDLSLQFIVVGKVYALIEIVGVVNNLPISGEDRAHEKGV